MEVVRVGEGHFWISETIYTSSLIDVVMNCLLISFSANALHAWFHYNDVIMGTMASQITSVAIVYSTVYSGADQRKHKSSASLAFCVGNSLGNGEFPAQMASNAESVSIWWRHHVWLIFKIDYVITCILCNFLQLIQTQCTIKIIFLLHSLCLFSNPFVIDEMRCSRLTIWWTDRRVASDLIPQGAPVTLP